MPLWLPVYVCVYLCVYASVMSRQVVVVVAAMGESWQRSLACNSLLYTASPSN